MAKYIGSPWGYIIGKLGNKVGFLWKGIPVSRQYVIPGNPKTQAQQRVRAIFSDVVKYSKTMPLIIYYKIANRSHMTQFNLWTKHNLRYVYTTESAMGKPYSPWVIRVYPIGDIQPARIIYATYKPDTGEFSVNWDTSLYGKGTAEDKMWLAIHHVARDTWYFIPTHKIRQDGSYSSYIWKDLEEQFIAHLHPVDKSLPDCCWLDRLGTCYPPDDPAPLLSTGKRMEMTMLKQVWQYGTSGVPGSGHNQLYLPNDADLLPNGNILISDTYNNRVIEVDRTHSIIRTWLFTQPYAADLLANGNILIASIDGVYEIDITGSIVWSYTGLGVCQDVHKLPNGNILIGCMENNVVREVDASFNIVWQYGTWGVPGAGYNQLHYPRKVKRLPNGNTLIGDYGSRRVIEVTRAKQIAWQYGQTYVSGTGPNQIRRGWAVDYINKDAYLISDMAGRRVIKVTKDKDIIWQYGKTDVIGYAINKLYTPYDVDYLPNGHVLITDAWNHRVLEVA
ncbi:MAG: NHL repeat-containing protein [bacterium]|nr:NHL repeat-containing protein [bacterium]